ncbi:DNA mismatch endonuclease Vsr [Sphingomonas sp. ZB1N12]|uniref:very short patch repair endonuclease n=1 Tax=Sphingomonas arabinosi TaxID=3096160 RepID=UPI002FC6F928
MADVVDVATRSRMMAGIRGRDTAPEVALRRALHRAGFRFRLHVAELPGKPDVVLPRWRAAVLVHGCFWHRHVDCRYATNPGTRPDFWATKFAGNVARDKRNHDALLDLGWRAATVWECALKKIKVDDTVVELTEWLRSDRVTLEIG